MASDSLSEHERDEWGDVVADSRIREYIDSYCPTQNIRKKLQKEPNVLQHPSIYCVTSLEDNNVPSWHSHNWISLVRKYFEKYEIQQSEIISTNNNIKMPSVWLRVFEGANHHGMRTLEEIYREKAIEISFLDSCILYPKF